MARAGDALDMPRLGIRIVFAETAAETGGERVLYEVLGRPRGFLTQAHIHPHQREHLEVLAGAAGLKMHGTRRVLRQGESVTIPPGTVHRHLAVDGGEEPRVRVELRPALRTETFLERLAELDRGGQINRFGFPAPVSGARLVLDFPDEGHAARPPVAVQRAAAAGLIGLAQRAARRERRYVFVDEWDVDAPIEAIFDALADARTYPDWWGRVYRSVEADGPPRLGQISRQHFKGLLPYQLRTSSEIVRLEPPNQVGAKVVGDLRGDGLWTLTQREGGRVHVRFDWIVYADKPLLRTLTPLLRPLFRWNHGWAIARAREGLEPYARRTAVRAPD
jgi:quercetin dioxygenase-like cupin family protein/uncharacterized protein YndB with AHSA1/START domain